MNNVQNSVTSECTLLVYFGKRAVNLLRTGKNRETFLPVKNSKKFIGDDRKTKSNEPAVERGWEKNTHTSVQQIKFLWDNTRLYSVSGSTANELNLNQKNALDLILGHIHDLAYEIARGAGYPVLEWKLTFNATGKTIICKGEWVDARYKFKIQQ